MEQRIREKAVRALSDILKTAGYDVHHAAPPLDLSASAEGRYLVIICSDDREEVSRFVDTEYSIRTESGEENCSKLLITFDSTIDVDGCLIWYPQDFVQYAGEMVMARILGRSIAIPMNEDSRPGHTGLSVGEDEPGDKIRIPHLPVRISRDTAEERSGIAGVVSLRFIPFWLYRYVSRGNASFKEQTVSFDGSGTGAVNAINGVFSDIDPDSVTRREIPASSDLVHPVISREEAITRITGQLVKMMTRQVKSRQVKGDAIFYEEKNLSPDHENFTIELKEVYIPVWQIKGKKIVEINANTGERLSEPMDDGVEVF